MTRLKNTRRKQALRYERYLNRLETKVSPQARIVGPMCVLYRLGWLDKVPYESQEHYLWRMKGYDREVNVIKQAIDIEKTKEKFKQGERTIVFSMGATHSPDTSVPENLDQDKVRDLFG